MDPDPKFLIECAKELTGIGAPVDVDALAEDVGIRLTPNESGKPRRSYMSDVLEPDLVDPNLMSEEAKQAEQDDKNAQNEIAKAKASQPAVVAPGAGGAANGNATPAKKTKKGPANAKEKAKAKKLTDKILLSDRPDKKVAGEVFAQLLEDYPADKLEWVLAGHWVGPQQVPVKDINTADRKRWRASHEPIEPYVDRIKKGRMKPVILVQTPKSLDIVDGHHRFLAYEELGWPVLAYVAEVHVKVGPWTELHSSQTKGSSKKPPSWLESAQRTAAMSYMDDVAQ
jgi:hypothetical protein